MFFIFSTWITSNNSTLYYLKMENLTPQTRTTRTQTPIPQTLPLPMQFIVGKSSVMPHFLKDFHRFFLSCPWTTICSQEMRSGTVNPISCPCRGHSWRLQEADKHTDMPPSFQGRWASQEVLSVHLREPEKIHLNIEIWHSNT